MPPEPSDHPSLERITLGAVGSTSDLARDRLESAAGPFLIRAREQTGGRGRQGRAWASPPGGLWMTLAWPARLVPPAATDALGLRVGLALTEAIAQHAGDAPDVRLKWPNDAMLAGRKVAGALTEIVPARERWILVGCGVNADLAHADLPPEIRPLATTLREQLGGSGHADRLAPALERRLIAALTSEEPTPRLARRAERRLFRLGETAPFRLPDGTRAEARLEGLDDRAHAIFLRDSGERFTAPASVELL